MASTKLNGDQEGSQQDNTNSRNTPDMRRALDVLKALAVLENHAKRGDGKIVYRELCDSLGYKIEDDTKNSDLRNKLISLMKELRTDQFEKRESDVRALLSELRALDIELLDASGTNEAKKISDNYNEERIVDMLSEWRKLKTTLSDPIISKDTDLKYKALGVFGDRMGYSVGAKVISQKLRMFYAKVSKKGIDLDAEMDYLPATLSAASAFDSKLKGLFPQLQPPPQQAPLPPPPPPPPQPAPQPQQKPLPPPPEPVQLIVRTPEEEKEFTGVMERLSRWKPENWREKVAEGQRLTTKITNYIASHGLEIPGRPKDYTNLERLSNQKVLADLKKKHGDRNMSYGTEIDKLTRIGAFENLSNDEKEDLSRMVYVELGAFEADLEILRHLSRTIDQREQQEVFKNKEAELLQQIKAYSYLDSRGEPDFDRLVDDYSKVGSYSDLTALISAWKASENQGVRSEETRMELVLRLHQIIVIERVPPPPPAPVPPAPWIANPERFISPTEATVMVGFIRDNGLEAFYAGRAIEKSYLEVRSGMPREQYSMLLDMLNKEAVRRMHEAEQSQPQPPPPPPSPTELTDDNSPDYDEGVPDPADGINPLDVISKGFNNLINPSLETPEEPQQPKPAAPPESLEREEGGAETPAQEPQKPVPASEDLIASTKAANSVEELAEMADGYAANKDSVELRTAVGGKIRELLPSIPAAKDRIHGSPLDKVLTAFDAAVYMTPSKLEPRKQQQQHVSFTASLDNLLRHEEGGGAKKMPRGKGKSG